MQIAYAAMDALVAVDIISALVNRKLVLDRGEHTDSTTAVQGHFVHWDTPEFNDVLHSMCEPFLDIGRSFKASSVNQVGQAHHSAIFYVYIICYIHSMYCFCYSFSVLMLYLYKVYCYVILIES